MIPPLPKHIIIHREYDQITGALALGRTADRDAILDADYHSTTEQAALAVALQREDLLPSGVRGLTDAWALLDSRQREMDLSEQNSYRQLRAPRLDPKPYPPQRQGSNEMATYWVHYRDRHGEINGYDAGEADTAREALIIHMQDIVGCPRDADEASTVKRFIAYHEDNFGSRPDVWAKNVDDGDDACHLRDVAPPDLD